MKGIESYCPLNKVHRKWSDRVKMIEEPLFKSYVFVKVPDEDRLTVRMTDGVVNFVYWNGKPAVIKEREILNIQKFLGQHENVSLINIDIKLNDQVVVTLGPLMDKEAKVIEVKNKVAKVVIESLGYILIASISKKNLFPINKLN
jgi:transcription antitermination factor NusG